MLGGGSAAGWLELDGRDVAAEPWSSWWATPPAMGGLPVATVLQELHDYDYLGGIRIPPSTRMTSAFM